MMMKLKMRNSLSIGIWKDWKNYSLNREGLKKVGFNLIYTLKSIDP